MQGFASIGKRSIDFIAVDKTDVRCKARLIEGVQFDRDVREAAVLKVSGNGPEVIVVAFEGSPEVLVLG